MSKAKSPRKPSTAAPAPVFPAPDHDHDQWSTDAMAVADLNARLNPLRVAGLLRGRRGDDPGGWKLLARQGFRLQA